MTTKRSFQAFRKMRPGSIGGQSRVATPVDPKTVYNPSTGAPAPEPDPSP